MARKPPASLSDMSTADRKAVWRAITKHLPLVAQRTTQAANALRLIGVEPTPAALRAATELQTDGFAVTKSNLKSAMLAWAITDRGA